MSQLNPRLPRDRLCVPVRKQPPLKRRHMGPLLPPFLSFASGIALAGPLDMGYAASVGALALSVCFVLALYLKKASFSPLASIPLFFSLGALFIIPHTTVEVPSDHILNIVRQDPAMSRAGVQVEGRAGVVENTGSRTRVWLEVDGARGSSGRTPASGTVLLTINAKADILPGDSLRAFAMLSEPRTFGNPGEFDYRLWLKRRGVLVTGYVKSERLIERVEAGKGLMASVQSARTKIGRFIDSSGASHPEPLKALVISGQGGVDRALKEAFAATGTAHILSISGLHIGMVAAFSYWAAFFLLRRSEKALLALDAKKTALVFSALPATAYAILAGLPVPTQRALIMVLAFVVSFSIGRGKDHINTLSFAGLIVLAVFPSSVWDASFQLSFIAMASIIIILPRLQELAGLAAPKTAGEKEGGTRQSVLSFLRRRALPLVLVTIAAGVGTSPVLAYHFQRVSLMGLFANLVAVPLSAAVVPCLLVSSLLLPVSETLAWLALFPADMVFGSMAWAIKIFAALPYASMWVRPPSFAEICLYYLLILSLANINRARFFRYAAPVAASLVILMPLARGLNGPPGTLKVTFLSVGQGDSAFVELPDGKTMLIDGGGMRNPDFDVGERVVAPFLRSKGVDRIDYMVLSHAQLDHMGGLLFLVRNLEVGEFWWNGRGDLGALGAALDEKGVTRKVVGYSTGSLGAGGAMVEFLGPSGEAGLDVNESSVVMKLVYGERAFLFTGDIGGKAERALASRGLRADVLKAAHHGSRYSSSAPFLEAVSPSVVVVSAGLFNSFGFPHAETLERYREAGAEVMRTDLSGAVIVETDGRTLWKKGYLTGEGL